jgi:hypothetical protein
VRAGVKREALVVARDHSLRENARLMEELSAAVSLALDGIRQGLARGTCDREPAPALLERADDASLDEFLEALTDATRLRRATRR